MVGIDIGKNSFHVVGMIGVVRSSSGGNGRVYVGDGMLFVVDGERGIDR